MATVTIKSGNSDDQATVDSLGRLMVVGTVNAVNPSVSATGAPAPDSATLAGGIDPDGNLAPLKINAAGELVMASSQSEGFAALAPGYPKQVSVGTTSTQILPANSGRKYAHIANNSQQAIYVQFSSAAALNQGIKIGPGGLYTLDIDNLWLGIVNGIGLIAGQLIDCIEGQ